MISRRQLSQMRESVSSMEVFNGGRVGRFRIVKTTDRLPVDLSDSSAFVESTGKPIDRTRIYPNSDVYYKFEKPGNNFVQINNQFLVEVEFEEAPKDHYAENVVQGFLLALMIALLLLALLAPLEF